MKLYFSKNKKQARNLYLLALVITVIIAIIVFNVREYDFLAIMYAFVAFVLLRIIVNSYVKRKDDKALYSLLNILYDRRNPELFLNEIEDKINFENLSKKQITNILIHKAIAKCYNGEIDEAKDLLTYIESKTEDDNSLLKLLFYKIMFKIIDGQSKGITEEIIAFKELTRLKKTDKIVKSNLKSDKTQLKYLEFFDNKINECDLLSKIVKSERLSKANDQLLDGYIKNADSQLQYEMLNYFAAVNKVNKNDLPEAINFLVKIETFPIGNTVIQKKALKLQNKIKE
jgi:hypothetical protein